jgi:hypothetical protein
MSATDRSTKRKKSISFSDQQTATSPKEISKNATFSFLASLPKPISLIGESIFHRYTKHCNDIDSIRARAVSLQPSSDKIPGSVKFNFELNSTGTIKEKQEFKEASHRCKEAIEYCQSLLKAEMLVATELELAEEKKKLKEYFCTATSLLAEAFIKNDPNTPNDVQSIQTLVYCTADKEYRTLMNEAKRIRDNANNTRTSQDDEEEVDNNDINIISKLFKFSGFKYNMSHPSDLDGFNNQFHYLTNGTETLPPAPGSANDDAYDLIGHLIRDFTATLYSLFYTSRTTYIDALEDKKRNAELTAWAKNALDVQATETIAMNIEEANLESPELGDLVDSKIAARLKRLDNTIKNQQKMINELKKSKNSTGGANRLQTTRTKKNNNKKKDARPAQKAGGVVNDSTDDSNGKMKKKKGKQLKQKKSTSRSSYNTNENK